MTLQRLHSATEVAEALGQTENYVREQCRRRAWPHVRLARGRVGFTGEDFTEIVRLCSVAPTAEPVQRFALAPRSRRAS